MDRCRGGITLRETEVTQLAMRTEWNVRDADATLIFSHGAPSGGTALTASFAERYGKPVLCVDLAGGDEAAAAEEVLAWLERCLAGDSERCRPARLERSADLRRGVAGAAPSFERR